MPPKPPLLNGDVVLVPFPFADLSANKVRPAVVVTADPQSSDLIVAFVTSVMTNHSPRGAEVPLLHADVEFHLTGLKMDSLIRLDKLTLSSTLISRRLGKVGPATKALLGPRRVAKAKAAARQKMEAMPLSEVRRVNEHAPRPQ